MKTHYFQIIFKVKTTRSETAEKSEGGQEDHGLIGAFSKVFQNSRKKNEISRFGAGKQEFLKSCFSPKFPKKMLISRQFSRQRRVVYALHFFLFSFSALV